MCNMDDRIKKVQAYVHQIASAYLVADSKLEMLKPLAYDEEFIKPFNNTVAANGLEMLLMTLLLDLIRDLVGMTQDKDKKTASLATVVKLIEDEQLKTALKKLFCQEENREKEFEENYQKIIEKQRTLIDSDLGQKLKKVRDKIVSHYEMTGIGEEPRPFRPKDFDLSWGDTEKYMSEAEPIIFNAVYLISRTTYVLEEYKKGHKQISQDFWNTLKQNSK